VFDVRGNAAQIQAGLWFRAGAHLGAVTSTDDAARLDVQFLDVSGAPVGFGADPVGPVTRVQRNQETVVVRRERLHPIPVGTAFVRVAVAFENACCGAAYGLVDNVSARLELPPAVVPPPFGVNLISNPSFEMGDLPGSPLELNNPKGWAGIGPGVVRVRAYGSGTDVPSTAFATANGLGGAVLQDLGSGALAQTVDLRGLATLVDSGGLVVDASIWLGGAGAQTDDARLRLYFRNEFGVLTGFLETLGPVTPADRMNLTELRRRTRSLAAPLGARSMTIEAVMTDQCCGAAFALIDSVEVILNANNSIGTPYCTATLNSTGAIGELRATGSELVSANNVTLVASGLPPSTFGYFLNGRAPAFVPNAGGSQGNLCLGGGIGRYSTPVLVSTPMGVMSRSIDLSLTPTPVGLVSVAVGETWYFQGWYRDAGTTATSNFTRGVRIDFQ
jgi:hypothetical protein